MVNKATILALVLAVLVCRGALAYDLNGGTAGTFNNMCGPNVRDKDQVVRITEICLGTLKTNPKNIIVLRLSDGRSLIYFASKERPGTDPNSSVISYQKWHEPKVGFEVTVVQKRVAGVWVVERASTSEESEYTLEVFPLKLVPSISL